MPGRKTDLRRESGLDTSQDIRSGARGKGGKSQGCGESTGQLARTWLSEHTTMPAYINRAVPSLGRRGYRNRALPDRSQTPLPRSNSGAHWRNERGGKLESIL